jgi:hypothetical protein
MKKLVLALVGLGIIGYAQDIKELEGLMKGTGKVMQTLKKCDADSAVAAKKVAEDYKLVEAWFAKKGGMADAVTWSKEASAAAADLATHAGAGNTEKAMPAFQKLAGTCRSCHDVHREKLPDGSYKLK